MSVRVHESSESLATTVATELLARLAAAQEAGETPQIGLTGGTIADQLHREVARLAPASSVDWSRVVVWWGDERFVDSSSSDRNAVQAREAFLSQVGVDPANVHEIPSASEVATAEEAAEAYSATLREHGAGSFTVLMLGIGPDAHIASLFPHFPQLEVEDEIAVAVHDSPKPPPDRVTLTFPALNRADEVWFLAAGEGKADAVAAALAPTGAVPDTPARGIAPTGTVTWHLDRAAASALP
ncbi:6-phosphogluconolactonase [Nocardioides rotundus]|uniref:6-phosphogluconolactonase n=1 Tax=Nocardioides rotundus TaxID=1774216 RepID=UPI001CBFB978|nr:6-phosphogluconolactonase [Nocardioides rotundus]UAL31624.1 6-phosphogluconolactonase [Nocardioides rotundus]